MKAASIHLSELAINDILEQANWYESRSDEKLAKRWERAVTSTLARIRRTPNAGSSCRFSAAELLGTRRVPVTVSRSPVSPSISFFTKWKAAKCSCCVSFTAHVILKTCLPDEPDQRRGNSFGQQPCMFSMK